MLKWLYNIEMSIVDIMSYIQNTIDANSPYMVKTVPIS